jgi:hypothetical protein
VKRAETVPLIRLPISRWTIRVGRGASGRAALEVYEGLRIADVCVATPVSVSVLRGALRGPREPRGGGVLSWLGGGGLRRSREDVAPREPRVDDEPRALCGQDPLPGLRGDDASRGRRGEDSWALAWGQLPPGVAMATVEFTGPGRSPVVSRVEAVLVERAYWVAEAAGDFTAVTVHAGPALVSGRLRRPGR